MQEKKVDEKEGWQPNVIKIEGCEKAGRTTIRMKKHHADGKVGESNPKNKSTWVIMYPNRVLVWTKYSFKP